MLPVVAIIGRTNVGKSTLFNRLTGKRKAITADWAGTTRDRLYEECSWNGKDFILVDTAGLETGDKNDSLDSDIQAQIRVAIEEADLLLFMVDCKAGIIEQDLRAAKKIHLTKKLVILVANKCDNLKDIFLANEFYRLGIKEMVPISALNGQGSGDLLDLVTKKIPRAKSQKNKQAENSTIQVAIAGRPNVGKSSLLNKLIGKERAVVSEKAGTTRDTADFTLLYEKKTLSFIDTAGIRRRGKVGQSQDGSRPGQIEKYSVLRSFRAIETSDVILLLIDAVDGITSQDLHIAGYANETKKSLILVINKWDALEDGNMQEYLEYLYKKVNFLPFAPVVFVSAKTGKNIQKIYDLILKVYQARFTRIPTAELNSKLQQDILKKPPGAKRNVLPNIKYITQAETNPPTFIFFSNHPEYIHFSYIRFLENKIRSHWDLDGTPLTISFKKKRS